MDKFNFWFVLCCYGCNERNKYKKNMREHVIKQKYTLKEKTLWKSINKSPSFT